MTRDEAINVLRKNVPVMAGAYSEFLDAFVALGMLKLDEPKGPNEKAVDAMFAHCIGGMLAPRHALEAILGAGLKIAEK